eukprot:TRINITY_DN30149_c0_g1_i1.p1 TRINITY_DN30149_c0_g1~~TRINITY_DN30149_c0_g1_i1.p1  ORF type:complete len:247 (+),score=40.86 TRINITY_DN30149_c0_g1_i1:127-867(+)
MIRPVPQTTWTQGGGGSWQPGYVNRVASNRPAFQVVGPTGYPIMQPNRPRAQPAPTVVTAQPVAEAKRISPVTAAPMTTTLSASPVVKTASVNMARTSTASTRQVGSPVIVSRGSVQMAAAAPTIVSAVAPVTNGSVTQVAVAPMSARVSVSGPVMTTMPSQAKGVTFGARTSVTYTQPSEGVQIVGLEGLENLARRSSRRSMASARSSMVSEFWEDQDIEEDQLQAAAKLLAKLQAKRGGVPQKR